MLNDRLLAENVLHVFDLQYFVDLNHILSGCNILTMVNTSSQHDNCGSIENSAILLPDLVNKPSYNAPYWFIHYHHKTNNFGFFFFSEKIKFFFFFFFFDNECIYVDQHLDYHYLNF